jgi:hypothetical protein
MSPFDCTLHPNPLEVMVPPLLETQVFEYPQVPRQPPRIWVEGDFMPAPEVLGIIVRIAQKVSLTVTFPPCGGRWGWGDFRINDTPLSLCFCVTRIVLHCTHQYRRVRLRSVG